MRSLLACLFLVACGSAPTLEFNVWGSRGPQLIAQPDWNPPLETEDTNHFGAGLTLVIPLGPTENVVRIVEAPTPPTPVLEVPELGVLTEVMRGMAAKLSSWPTTANDGPQPPTDPSFVGPPPPEDDVKETIGWFDKLGLPTQIIIGVLLLAVVVLYRKAMLAMLSRIPGLRWLPHNGHPPKEKPK